MVSLAAFLSILLYLKTVSLNDIASLTIELCTVHVTVYIFSFKGFYLNLLKKYTW